MYRLWTRKRPWKTAKTICESVGSHLAALDTQQTHKYVINTFTTTESLQGRGIWVGGKDIYSNNTWQWLDGTPIDQSFWFGNEPNNYQGIQEDCAMINFNGTRGMLDAHCDWTEPAFLCQKGNVENNNNAYLLKENISFYISFDPSFIFQMP